MPTTPIEAYAPKLEFFDHTDYMTFEHASEKKDLMDQIDSIFSTATVKVGSKFIIVDGEEVEISMNSKTWNDCVYMPVDAVDLICGSATTFDAAAKTVTIAK